MRALKVAVVVMGLVIIAGTGLLVVTIVQRVFHPHPGAPVASVQAPARPAVPQPAVPQPAVSRPAVPRPAVSRPAVPASVTLDEPAGTHIVAVGGYGQGLAVTLSGGGPDRVVLLDRALRVIGRITLAR